ncbi:MAG: hypothetical protein KJ999_21320 [Gammaproteobacteria bacterium]|nr:hypothetical protein [Gammaproteobacteria bacterium]
MKHIGSTVLALCALCGCAHNGTMSQEEQLRIMKVIEASRRAAAESFTLYREICQRELPAATNARDDGGTHLSMQGAVNVALDNLGHEIVCSVDIEKAAIEAIWADHRVYTLKEYKLVDAERRRRMALAQADAAQIQSGNHGTFVLAAKRSITSDFKDPDSVLYRDVFISNRTTPTLCGEINAKNSYGGYIGYKRFFYNRIVSGVNGSEIPDSSASYSKLESVYCRDKMLDLPQ